ncbi:conserved protein of unknown function [Ralstonia solanacearum CMR15]|nr:conserved protein of unknown function [Ralstonia solanacearum CMR15]
MTTTNNGSVFEHRYEAVENLVHEAARWALARRERQARHDLAGDLQTDEQNAAQDLEDAVHEVALYGIEAHSDDLHVDATANAMKRRLAEKRAAGYHGWNDPHDCRIENLAILLHRSLRKGNALDVANFAMMLYRREAAPEAITAALSPWLAGQQPAAEPAPHVDLQGLHDALLAPRKILRDAEGWLTHPALPAVDEDVNCRQLLAAFGIETFMRDMEADADDATVKRYFTDGHPGCSDWTPTPPEGDGWRLLEIFDTEDGPHALFGRAARLVADQRAGANEGWKAMPPKLTPAMRTAFAQAAREYMQETGKNNPDAMYEAAFAAAPTQQAEPAADDGLEIFCAYVARNYCGDVVFDDPAWHAKRLWAAAKHALAIRAEERDTNAAQSGQRAGADGLETLRRMLCGIGIVGQIDGHDVIRRTSVIELVDRARADQLIKKP